MIAFYLSQLFRIDAKAIRVLHMTERYDSRVVGHRTAYVFDSHFACDRRQQMDSNPPMHPRQRGNRKLQVAPDYFASSFQSIHDHVHARRSICRERDLIRLGIDELCEAFSNFFLLSKPAIPMHVPVIHHLPVASLGRFVRDA